MPAYIATSTASALHNGNCEFELSSPHLGYQCGTDGYAFHNLWPQQKHERNIVGVYCVMGKIYSVAICWNSATNTAVFNVWNATLPAKMVGNACIGTM